MTLNLINVLTGLLVSGCLTAVAVAMLYTWRETLETDPRRGLAFTVAGVVLLMVAFTVGAVGRLAR